MKVWQAFLAAILLGILLALLIYAAISLPWWTFTLMLVVVGICLLDKNLKGGKNG